MDKREDDMIKLYRGKNNKSYFVSDNEREAYKGAMDKLKKRGIITSLGYVIGDDLYLDKPEGKSKVVYVAYVK